MLDARHVICGSAPRGERISCRILLYSLCLCVCVFIYIRLRLKPSPDRKSPSVLRSSCRLRRRIRGGEKGEGHGERNGFHGFGGKSHVGFRFFVI